jgi:hypothetical protein
MNDFINELPLHIVPTLAIVGYINYPKDFRINASLLYFLSLIHNGLLVAFSAWTCWSLFDIIYSDEIVIQHNHYFQNPKFDTIVYYFYLSKYWEFFDTFLLYLNGKTPISLQKYHHIGAVICWHLTYVYKVDAIWTASIANSFVHTIMYAYYLGTLLKINKLRVIRPYLTQIQLVQQFGSMVTGNLYIKVETTKNIIIIGIVNIYTFFLMILFGSFYYKQYIKKN